MYLLIYFIFSKIFGFFFIEKNKKQKVPEELLKFGTHTKKKEHDLYGAHFKDHGEEVLPEATHITFDD